MMKSFPLSSFLILILSCKVVLLVSCQKVQYSEYTPDFSYEISDDDPNLVRFINTTTGDQAYMQWDFGNGKTTARQPSNSLSYSVDYPIKGEYPVTLTVWGDSGYEDDKKSVTKIVRIEYSAPVPDFEYELISGSPNLLKLTDVSTGDYDEITWRYPGREFKGVPAEVRILYLAMGGNYNIELELRRDGITKTITKTVTVPSDDPDFINKYELVWSDEFDGTATDDSRWVHETGDHGWGNQEWQNYTDGDNTSLSDGTMKITVEKTGTGQKVGDYTSSRLNSTESFVYGRFEIRAKMPDYEGPGLWPALWMLGESIQEGTPWPLCGEIDIMEYVSWNPDKCGSAIHIESNNHSQGNAITSGDIPLPSIEEEFHIYGLIWTYKYLKFYIDDVENIILTYNKPGNHDDNNWPFYKPFYFLLNVAVGGTYGGVSGVDDSIFPATMEIDYVRVYQLNQ